MFQASDLTMETKAIDLQLVPHTNVLTSTILKDALPSKSLNLRFNFFDVDTNTENNMKELKFGKYP